MIRSKLRDSFYHRKAWKDVRLLVWIKQSCLCSRCCKPVYVEGLSDSSIPKEKRRKGIVHHKVYLTDENLYDLNISLNLDNLEGLCIDCHNEEHFKVDSTRSDVYFDENGNLLQK